MPPRPNSLQCKYNIFFAIYARLRGLYFVANSTYFVMQSTYTQMHFYSKLSGKTKNSKKADTNNTIDTIMAKIISIVTPTLFKEYLYYFLNCICLKAFFSFGITGIN